MTSAPNSIVDMKRPERVHRYEGPAADSARWNRFKPRKGDIIVCTAPKSGTTWTQMICALLVHQTPDLPMPLTRLSRWLDRVSQPIEDVVADFEAQTFRRVVKTHTPLDGLPYWDEVSYIVCGRDPRDAALSATDHLANLSEATIEEARKRSGLPADLTLPDDPNAFFPIVVTMGDQSWTKDGFPMGSVLYFAESYWKFRKLPNMCFLHYADLTDDLAGEMRGLSKFLGIAVDEAKFPALVKAASFGAMKDRAGETAPGAHLGEWTKNEDFFRKARLGEWQKVLTPENKALYDQVATERLDPHLRAWLEGGRKAAGDPRSI